MKFRTIDGMSTPRVEDSSSNDIIEKLLHEMPEFTVRPASPTKEDKSRARLMQYILDKHFENDDNVVQFNKSAYKKFREYAQHYMTCTDHNHAHGVINVRWEPKDEI